MKLAPTCLLACAAFAGAGTAQARKKHTHTHAHAHPPATGAEAAPKKKHHHRSWPLPAAGPTMSGDPELILTFDDGPNPRTTPLVLDALARHHIHATFFLVGEMAAHPSSAAIIRRELRDGHIIGNHTMTHKDLCRVTDEDEAAHEIDDSKAVIVKASGGFEPVWFRTPYGVRCDRVEQLLAERHLKHFHWDLDPQEWRHNDPVKAIAYVEKEVGKMTGRNVLLMHDIKTATVKALPEILDWIDAENARRAAAHQRQIRIIPSYQLAIEWLPPGLADWIVDAAPDPTALAHAIGAVIP